MGSKRDKDALFEAIALMGKAFASPRRLELLDLLAQAPRNVDELARASGQSAANTSQHLQALHAAGMVTRSREGTSVRYALAGDRALALWLALRDASVAQLAEVEHGLAGRDCREVEEVADAGERVDRRSRDAVEVRGVIAEALGQRPPGLEMELALGLECDLLVHAADALLELGRVESANFDRHGTAPLGC